MKKTIITVILWFIGLCLVAQTVSFSDLSISMRNDGSGLFDVYFTLVGNEGPHNINFEASFDDGVTFVPVSQEYLSGHLTGVAPGEERHIVWDGLGSFPNIYNTETRIRLTSATGDCGPEIPQPSW
jgi:hypothetical protein